MKVALKKLSYEKAMARKRPVHRNPLRPNFLLALVIRALAVFDLLPTRFTYTTDGLEKIGKKEPCLILMNHSSFLDLKIASGIFFPKRYNIVCTYDAFVGPFMGLLMRLIGCIPTRKFISDLQLIKDMDYALKKKKSSVLMFPEAGYTFDGTTTTLPRKLGVLMKKLGVPVVTVITNGAFARDPLYNGLQLRKVKVSAHVKVLATAEEVKSLSVAELDARLDEAFSFDGFRTQQENRVCIDEPFRADGLDRILYKCPHCDAEGTLTGQGISLTCNHCGSTYTLTEYGALAHADNKAEFTHIPDWFAWQREQVKKELEDGTYKLETPVDIVLFTDYAALYKVGEGMLTHDENGFSLTGCDGKLNYTQKTLSSYSICADFFFYEIGDVICIGDHDVLYYCFPKDKKVSVAKVRLAAEEAYKLKKRRPVLV